MSKSLTGGMATAISQVETTLAICWKLTVDAVSPVAVWGFTNHDADIVYQGVTYSAKSGHSNTNIQSTIDLQADNLEVFGLLDSETITEADLLAGLFDGAMLEMFVVDYAHLAYGDVPILKGEIGEISMQGGKFVAQFMSILTYLDQIVPPVYSYHCRVKRFCDEECGLNEADYTFTGTVTGVTSRGLFTTDLANEAGLFTYGIITWTSGLNDGLQMEVKNHGGYDSPPDPGIVELFMKMPYDVQEGDAFSIFAGCDRTPAMCKSRNNIVNYRGEPLLKGLDRLYSYNPTNPYGIKD